MLNVVLLSVTFFIVIPRNVSIGVIMLRVIAPFKYVGSLKIVN